MDKFRNIEIPKNIDEITKKAISRGKFEKSKQNYKKISIACGLSMMFLTWFIGAGILNPSLVSAMPKVQKIFEDLNRNFGLDREYINYTQGIGKSQTINGVTVSIDEAVSDGHNLYLTYIITSEDKLPRVENNGVDNDILEIESEINIENSTLLGATSLSGYYKDDYTFVGMESYNLSFYGEEAPKEFDIDLNIKRIYKYDNLHRKLVDEKKGPFNFNFKVNTTIDVNTISVNKSKDKLKVNKVEVSPYSINVNIAFPKSYIQEPDKLLEYSVVVDASYKEGKNIARKSYSLDDLDISGAKLVGNTVYDSILINYKELGFNKKPEYIVVKFLDKNTPQQKQNELKYKEFKIYLNKN